MDSRVWGAWIASSPTATTARMTTNRNIQATGTAE
jgi:hypothetical protein